MINPFENCIHPLAKPSPKAANNRDGFVFHQDEISNFDVKQTILFKKSKLGKSNTALYRFAKRPQNQDKRAQAKRMVTNGKVLLTDQILMARPAKAPPSICNVPMRADALPNRRECRLMAKAAELGLFMLNATIYKIKHSMIKWQYSLYIKI